MNTREFAMFSVNQERDRQDRLWGEQNHHPLEWLSILGEEFGSACKAANNTYWKWVKDGITQNYEEYEKEVTQVAAVAVAMLESLHRGKWRYQDSRKGRAIIDHLEKSS